MFPCSHSLFPSPSSGNSSCPLIGPPTEPRFESRRCDLCQSQEEKQTDLPTHLKVANRSGLEAETLSRGLRLAAGGAKRPPRGVPRGVSPLGDSLVTFSSGRKSPGVEGRSALLVGAGATSSAQTPRSLRSLYKKRIPDACQQIAGRRRHKGAAGRAVPALLLPAGADGLGRLLDRVDHRLLLHPALL